MTKKRNRTNVNVFQVILGFQTKVVTVTLLGMMYTFNWYQKHQYRKKLKSNLLLLLT